MDARWRRVERRLTGSVRPVRIEVGRRGWRSGGTDGGQVVPATAPARTEVGGDALEVGWAKLATCVAPDAYGDGDCVWVSGLYPPLEVVVSRCEPILGIG